MPSLIRLICFGCFLSLVACSQPETKQPSTPTVTETPVPDVISSSTPTASAPIYQSRDTLQFDAVPELEILEVVLSRDSLLVVSESKQVAYPLGTFDSPQKFRSLHPGFSLTSSERPDNSGDIRIYTMQRGNNSVRLIKTEDKLLDIISGKIVDQDISLATRVRVGMSTSEFLNLFFAKLSVLNPESVKVISLIFGAEGQIQHCRFENGVLQEIALISNYTIQ